MKAGERERERARAQQTSGFLRAGSFLLSERALCVCMLYVYVYVCVRERECVCVCECVYVSWSQTLGFQRSLSFTLPVCACVRE